MEGNDKQERLHIEGMTCTSCAGRIEAGLSRKKGIKHIEVSFGSGYATYTYDEQLISRGEIIEEVEALGYSVKSEEDISQQPYKMVKVLGITVSMIALYRLMSYYGLTDIFYRFPEAEENMEYGMLFVLGIFTSIHCIAMCGGINLTQCLAYREWDKQDGGWTQAIKPSLLYNIGRVFAYTLIGGIVGGLGSIVSFSETMKGSIQIIASVFMIIMGLNMLNIIPGLHRFNPRIPKSLSNKLRIRHISKSPFYIGMLNGLMPCGPLQAMQLYALSTGSPIKGAFAMFLFSIGTVPLMLGVGILSTVLSKKFTKKIMTVGAVLVVLLGISMLNSGLSLAGIVVPRATATQTIHQAKMEDGIQVVRTTLAPGQYSAISVKAGVPVRWIMTADKGSINGCNNRIFIPEYGIEKRFQLGENIIEFVPTEEGTFSYSCWMGMIRSTIVVTK